VKLHSDTLSDLAVLECEGRLSSVQDALRLRYAVMLQRTLVIIIDMTEVTDVDGEGLEMLIFLRHWTVAHDIRLRLYNPSPLVRIKLQHAGFVAELKIALDDMICLVEDRPSTFAAAA
jgi:anti-anti-sigma regulatory factor